jgi:hypothetical protein
LTISKTRPSVIQRKSNVLIPSQKPVFQRAQAAREKKPLKNPLAQKLQKNQRGENHNAREESD